MMRKNITDPVNVNSKINADSGLIRKKFDYLGTVGLMTVILAKEDVKDRVMDSLLALRNIWILNEATEHKEKN